MANKKFDNAKKNKNDEFYTQLIDIEKELKHYKSEFKGKTVFCNCDDSFESNFFKYFAMNFNHLGLKKLICTSHATSPIAGEQLCWLESGNIKFNIKEGKKAYKIEITEVTDYNDDGAVDLTDIEYLLNNKNNALTVLESDGDFRSEECVELLKEADIVVTNPPFSLFREYVAQLIEYDKKFLIIGNQNAITYKEIFPLIKENKMFLGLTMNGSNRYFQVPDYYPLTEKTGKIEKGKKYAFVKSVVWFTNFNVFASRDEVIPFKQYTLEEYPKYNNYDAIEVSNVTDIPINYDFEMGVPITFLHKYNPEQFEIIALGIVGSINFTNERKMEILDKFGNPTGKFTINAKGTLYRDFNPSRDKKPPAFKDCETGALYSSIYARIIIRRKK